MSGANPIRWKCKERGCFNLKKRPKIEVFAQCFPRKIAMGDVDGLIELGGHFLMLEWKMPGAPVPRAQEMVYERITAWDRFTVIVVWGDAETMDVTSYAIYRKTKRRETGTIDLQGLIERIKGWAVYAETGKTKPG